jgi:hypothetical protein
MYAVAERQGSLCAHACHQAFALIKSCRRMPPMISQGRLTTTSPCRTSYPSSGRAMPRAGQGCSSNDPLHDSDRQPETANVTSNATALDYQPIFDFHNNVRGSGATEKFAERWLLPFFHADPLRLADMIRLVPDFPCPGVDFVKC